MNKRETNDAAAALTDSDSSLIPHPSSLRNYRLTIQYDGTEFHGWQEQDGLRTVQGEVGRALSLVEGRDVVLHGAGRTDAGVHAEAQVASVALARGMSPERLRDAVNGNVGRDVRVICAREAPADFHARFSARGKTYLYRVFNERFMSPFWLRYAHHESRPLDVAAMQRAAALFVGEHDWAAFSSAQAEVTSRVRTVTEASVEERPDARGRGLVVEFRVGADGFIRYMVRSMAGALLAVGRGEMSEGEVREAVEGGARAGAAATAPARGLTLVEVRY